MYKIQTKHIAIDQATLSAITEFVLVALSDIVDRIFRYLPCDVPSRVLTKYKFKCHLVRIPRWRTLQVDIPARGQMELTRHKTRAN